jgi:hypothetical protein
VWRYVFWATIGGLAVAMLHAPLKLALLYRVLVEIIVTPPPMLVVLCALALSFFVARLGRGLPVIVMGPVAAALEIAHVKLGGPIPESFCRWFVYLYLGHAFAPEIRALARWIPRNRETAIASVVTFAMIDIFAAVPPIPWTGDLTLAQLPFASLGLGVAGALAVIVTARLVEEQPETRYLRCIGANALSVYLVAYVALVAFAACAPKAPDAFPPGLGLMLAGALVLCAALAVLRSGRVATRPEAHIDLGKAFARMASRFAPR